MIWIVLGCCWVSQIRTKPTKNIWGPLLDSISSYYVQCPWKIVSFFQVFRHLNYHILVFFPAYIGLYWTPAGWYGQKPYLGPAHMWLRQNMAVCDAELGPKWGGVTNTRFTFLASYSIKNWSRFDISRAQTRLGEEDALRLWGVQISENFIRTFTGWDSRRMASRGRKTN